MPRNRKPGRKTARIRHEHEAHKIPGLRDKMIADGIDSLQVEKVYKDLGQLKDFEFLTDLSIRGLKKGIAAVGNLTKLEELALWDIRGLDSLKKIANAPNLRSIVVQKTPKIKVSDLEWMLEHPTLEQVYPALAPVKGDPILDEIQELLGPRFGDDLF